MIQVKKFHPKKTIGPKNIWIKQIQSVEKNSTATKFSIQKSFGSEKKGGLELNFGPKKVVFKKFSGQKSHRSEQFLCQRKLLVKKNLG